MKTRTFSQLIGAATAAAAIGGVLMLCGCGSGGSGGPNREQDAKGLATATQMRAYFDKVHGDYAQLSDPDKAAFVELAGGEKKADEKWSAMKNGPSRSAAESGAPADAKTGAPSGNGSL